MSMPALVPNSTLLTIAQRQRSRGDPPVGAGEVAGEYASTSGSTDSNA